MTAEEFDILYDFHDGDVFLPFEIQEDAITITFDLARWIQRKWVEEKYGKATYGDHRSFIVKAKFSHCKNIVAKEWVFKKSRPNNDKKPERIITETTLQAFDPELMLEFVETENQNEISLWFFSSDIKGKGFDGKGGMICFSAENVEVIEEALYDKTATDALYDKFEKLAVKYANNEAE